MRFIWFVFVVAIIGWVIERAVRRGELAATKANDADIERSIRRGQGQDAKVDGVISVGVARWLIFAVMGGLILWLWLSS
jgi:hypothetical protein